MTRSRIPAYDPRVRKRILLAVALLAAAAAWWWSTRPEPAVRVSLIGPPETDAVPAINGHTAILISGRRVTPAGRVIRTQSYSWGMAVSPDQSRIALVRAGAIELVDLRNPGASVRIPPYGADAPKELGDGTYMGVAFSPDGRRLYFGSANSGELKALDLAAVPGELAPPGAPSALPGRCHGGRGEQQGQAGRRPGAPGGRGHRAPRAP